MTSKLDSDFHQAMVRAINLVAQEGWELILVGQGLLIWYFKRPTKK
jgi:hypothetical protein